MAKPLLRYAGATCLIGAIIGAELRLIRAALTPAPRETYRCFTDWPKGTSEWCSIVRAG